MMRRTAARRISALREVCAAELAAIQTAGTMKLERIIVSPQSGAIKVAGLGDTPALNFCANNYLGLSNNQRIINVAKKTLDDRGFGLSSVRFICGTTDVHKSLEDDISRFLGKEDTILYPSCFDANGGVFESLLTKDDCIISDALNHASIIDGVRLCKAERHRYQHLDMAELEQILQKTQNKRIRMIATDGVFSMDGDVAPLDKIVALAEKYSASILVDDSHATGYMGPGGKGTPALFGVADKVDIINSTLGKALGGASGGFSSGTKEVVALQRQKGRPYLFSNTVAPCVAAGSHEGLKILQENPSLLKQLSSVTTQFRKGMKAAGFTVLGHDSCPIVPILLGDARLANQFADKMLKKAIYVIGFSYPVVPKGEARIRVQLSAAHSNEDVDRAIKAFIEIKKELGC